MNDMTFPTNIIQSTPENKMSKILKISIQKLFYSSGNTTGAMQYSRRLSK